MYFFMVPSALSSTGMEGDQSHTSLPVDSISSFMVPHHYMTIIIGYSRIGEKEFSLRNYALINFVNVLGP